MFKNKEIEKDIAIEILEDIEQSLMGKNPKKEGLKTLEIYRKNIEISINENINKLIEKYTGYVEKYGENGRKTIKLAKKIDKEMQKFYNS